ncbi:hypothetical protein C0991_004856 [Blastosporella zonata]|nr:hypothetical protein C0991_004856 [Blastosporella zonata]
MERSQPAVRCPLNCVIITPLIKCTTGSDGTIHFWDKDARTRLKTFEPAPGPISTTSFSRNGNIFAYAVSYDWSKGHSGMTPGQPNKIMLHACKDEEVRKRPTRK